MTIESKDDVHAAGRWIQTLQRSGGKKDICNATFRVPEGQDADQVIAVAERLKSPGTELAIDRSSGVTIGATVDISVYQGLQSVQGGRFA